MCEGNRAQLGIFIASYALQSFLIRVVVRSSSSVGASDVVAGPSD